MAVVQADDELLEDPPCLLLRQAAMRPVPQGVVEQVPPLSVLHSDRQMRRSQEHLEQAAHATQCPEQVERM